MSDKKMIKPDSNDFAVDRGNPLVFRMSVADAAPRPIPISAAPTMALRPQPPQATNQTQQAQSQQPPVAKK